MRKCAWLMIVLLLVSVSCVFVLKAPDIARCVEYKVTEARLKEQVKQLRHSKRMVRLRDDYTFLRKIASAD